MTRPGYTGLSLRTDVVEVLLEIAPRLGLRVVRPGDHRREGSVAAAVEALILWARDRVPRERPTLEDAVARAQQRELEEILREVRP